jgi:N-acetylmuramoyl-L-alanine amidase
MTAMTMPKIALVIGHNSRAQGAVRVTDGRTEYDWNSDLAALIRDHAPDRIEIFRRTPGLGYSREIDRVYAEVDEWGADCSIELHFNAAASPQARGCLMLSSGTSGSMGLARELQMACLRVMESRDRGVQVRGRRDRGGRSLWQGKSPAVLTEPYFGSNVAECIRADANIDQLAEAHFRAVQAWFAWSE